jgi:hypothetical protein
LHLVEEEGGEDPWDSRITIQEIHTSIASTKGEDIALKGERPIRWPDGEEWMGADKNSSRRRLKLRQDEPAR